jgi:hypothetical protein
MNYISDILYWISTGSGHRIADYSFRTLFIAYRQFFRSVPVNP